MWIRCYGYERDKQAYRNIYTIVQTSQVHICEWENVPHNYKGSIIRRFRQTMQTLRETTAAFHYMISLYIKKVLKTTMSTWDIRRFSIGRSLDPPTKIKRAGRGQCKKSAREWSTWVNTNVDRWSELFVSMMTYAIESDRNGVTFQLWLK